MKERIGEATGLIWNLGKITWKKNNDSQKINWEALANHMLEGFTQEEIDLYKREYAETTPGPRVLRFRDTFNSGKDDDNGNR